MTATQTATQTAVTIDFEEFKAIVLNEWPNADGHFCIPTGLSSKRTLYEWRSHSHAAVVYDTADSPTPWYVDNGRGASGRGASYEAADRAEAKKYDKGYREFNNR